jgi:hypothetical protein
MIYVIGPNHPEPPQGATVINTTSRSTDWSRGLSPFYAGPVDLYDGYRSLNVENAWQYSKVYEYYTDDQGNPDERYFNWAQDGWRSIRAQRYPMGKGVKPLYSYWAGEHLEYIEARKRIYIPLYSSAVQKTFAFKNLKKMHAAGKTLYLWDFDGYNHKALGLSYEHIINDPNKSLGHAFVIAMLLEGFSI